MAKKESQDGKSKKGLPRLMELAIYFIIQEIVGAYPDFSTLDVPKVLGYGGLALGGVLLNVLLCTASVELSHIAAYGTLYQCKINYVSHITKLPLDYHLKRWAAVSCGRSWMITLKAWKDSSPTTFPT